MKALQEESVFRGEGGLKEELIELCSPRCQSAAFLTVPAGAESGQNIHHQLHARASLSTFQEGCISKSWPLCVCLQPAWAGSMFQLLLLLSRGGARKTATKQNNSPFCPFWAFRLFARISLGPFSTWLIHLVFCWPLLPWLTGNTSVTSHRG